MQSAAKEIAVNGEFMFMTSGFLILLPTLWVYFLFSRPSRKKTPKHITEQNEHINFQDFHQPIVEDLWSFENTNETKLIKFYLTLQANNPMLKVYVNVGWNELCEINWNAT